MRIANAVLGQASRSGELSGQHRERGQTATAPARQQHGQIRRHASAMCAHKHGAMVRGRARRKSGRRRAAPATSKRDESWGCAGQCQHSHDHASDAQHEVQQDIGDVEDRRRWAARRRTRRSAATAQDQTGKHSAVWLHQGPDQPQRRARVVFAPIALVRRRRSGNARRRDTDTGSSRGTAAARRSWKTRCSDRDPWPSRRPSAGSRASSPAAAAAARRVETAAQISSPEPMITRRSSTSRQQFAHVAVARVEAGRRIPEGGGRNAVVEECIGLFALAGRCAIRENPRKCRSADSERDLLLPHLRRRTRLRSGRFRPSRRRDSVTIRSLRLAERNCTGTAMVFGLPAGMPISSIHRLPVAGGVLHLEIRHDQPALSLPATPRGKCCHRANRPSRSAAARRVPIGRAACRNRDPACAARRRPVRSARN